MQRRIAKLIINVLLLAVLLAFTALLAWAVDARQMPALQIWHTERLKEEFKARDATARTTLEEYLAQEARLFRELHDKIQQHIAPSADMIYSRYRLGGPQDPAWGQTNWNRTFELVPDQIQGGALLLHGLSDSPYSLRRVGEMLHAKGFYVLGMRLPGHGTTPGALARANWEDWVAASKIGARHVHDRIGPARPFVIVGYSNGGGLAVKYALDALDDPQLPAPDRLLLFSPEIGIMRLAFIASAHKLLSFIPFFAKSKWVSIEPEYDPFKYNSFPKHAVQEAWDVTTTLQRQVRKARRTERIRALPRVLTFLSWADATVETSATVERFYGQLISTNSELVVFDMNRGDTFKAFIPSTHADRLQQLEARHDLPYRLTVVSSAAGDSDRVVARSRGARADESTATELPLAWPSGVYSLSHVAIPFAPDDPIYGTGERSAHDYTGIALGALNLRGETHLLVAPASQLMRLRHNPFFPYMEARLNGEIESVLTEFSKPDERQQGLVESGP